ncbi:MAG: Gfo/Idh/MocA family protein [Aestuariivirga sp.]
MKKVRYAVVGAGWISQEAFMPSVDQTGNSEMTAIVTGNLEKAKKLADFYGIKHVYPYERYDEMLKAGVADAVYIALPNSIHADYAIRAANAGVHALVEKPLAMTAAECEAMIAAAAKAGVWLMTAYRLHNEPGTLEVLDMVRRGDIGDPRMFSSVFCFQSGPENHRLLAEHWGGPLQDLGVYCVNAVRHIFASEPIEARAMRDAGPGDPRFREVEETICATLRFPGGRIANFFSSFGASSFESYTIAGTSGVIDVYFGYRFETARRIRVIRDQEVTEKVVPHVENFSGQTAYFSDCILKGVRPESDGEEGLADMRALLAIEEAARTGKPQKIVSPPRPVHPTMDMVRSFPPVSRRLLV